MWTYYLKKQLIKIRSSLDSSRPYGRLLENLKTWDFRDLFLPENVFKTCFPINCRKLLKKRNLWFLEFYIYLKYISNKDDIWQRETLPGVLLEQRKLNISKWFQKHNIPKSVMVFQKCKNILLQAAIKDFWSSANLKPEKLSLSELSLLQDYIYWKNARMGVHRSYFYLQVI